MATFDQNVPLTAEVVEDDIAPGTLWQRCDDWLERTGERTIESIEYLPSEQLPLVVGAKLSILDVRCKDRTGTSFVVEMQLIHVPGFINRVVYNASITGDVSGARSG